MRRVVRVCIFVRSQDCNSAAECAEVEVGKKDPQLGAQAGSVVRPTSFGYNKEEQFL